MSETIENALSRCGIDYSTFNFRIDCSSVLIDNSGLRGLIVINDLKRNKDVKFTLVTEKSEGQSTLKLLGKDQIVHYVKTYNGLEFHLRFQRESLEREIIREILCNVERFPIPEASAQFASEMLTTSILMSMQGAVLFPATYLADRVKSVRDSLPRGTVSYVNKMNIDNPFLNLLIHQKNYLDKLYLERTEPEYVKLVQFTERELDDILRVFDCGRGHSEYKALQGVMDYLIYWNNGRDSLEKYCLHGHEEGIFSNYLVNVDCLLGTDDLLQKTLDLYLDIMSSFEDNNYHDQKPRFITRDNMLHRELTQHFSRCKDSCPRRSIDYFKGV